MHRSLHLSLAVGGVILASIASKPATAHADTWHLPVELNDSNTTISFVVDSTFHTVHGATKNISGSVRLLEPRDPLSVRVELSLPVALFNTDWQSRDEKLRKVMASEIFPKVSFVAERLTGDCRPEKITADAWCRAEMQGVLTIRDSTKKLLLAAEISRSAETYVVRGEVPIRWEEFNVEDPSILIAKLDPVVTITYQTQIPIQH
jgi:polyisoprenoid-binding protein YceI